MDLQTQQELAKNITALGHGFEEFKTTHQKALTDRDVLLEEKMKKLADLIGEKHELAMKALAAEVAGIQRPAGGDSQDVTKTAKERLAHSFAVHRKSVQMPDREGDGLGTMRRTYGSDFPGYEPSWDVVERYNKAFRRYLEVGNKDSLSLMGPELTKDMSVGIDPDGGYFLLPPQIADRVVMRIFETSPMWELADVANISSRSLIIPEDPSDINAGWVTERTSRTATTTITPGRVEIPAQEEYAEPAISQQLIEDSAVDLDGYLANKLSDKLMRIENTAFVGGSGSGQPKGFLSYPTTVVSSGNFSGYNQLEQVNSGDSGNFTYVGLTKLVTSLKENYQNNAQMLVRRQSIFYILNITDNNGRLIFQPLLNGNLNKTPLLGYPLRYATDMPDVAAGANAMAFGDWKQGYQIVNRVGISILRDPYTAKPFILIYTRKRVGGAVKDFDAIKIHSLQ
jgi:HK97 family phage major capsid protein